MNIDVLSIHNFSRGNKQVLVDHNHFSNYLYLQKYCDNTCDLSAPIASRHNDPGKTKLNEQEESLEEVGAPVDFTKHRATIIKHHNCLLYRDFHQGYITTHS